MKIQNNKQQVKSVATVLTACGIETIGSKAVPGPAFALQQCLPLAVLKLLRVGIRLSSHSPVATVLTACGIETIEIYRHLI